MTDRLWVCCRLGVEEEGALRFTLEGRLQELDHLQQDLVEERENTHRQRIRALDLKHELHEVRPTPTSHPRPTSHITPPTSHLPRPTPHLPPPTSHLPSPTSHEIHLPSTLVSDRRAAIKCLMVMCPSATHYFITADSSPLKCCLFTVYTI